MHSLRQQLTASSIHAHVAPYIIILALTFVQDTFTGPGRYWMYFAKMLVGAWCIWEVRALVPEARWALSWEAVVAGVLVFLIWVGLDPYYPKLSASKNFWNPLKEFGEGSALGFFFIGVRAVGSAVVVPPIEEAFYRSFLYRWFVRRDFSEMPLNQLHWLSLAVTSLIFGFVHNQWLAGVLCGLIYQALVLRKNRLGDAMTAHGITNFLLAIYIPWQNAWQFW